MTQGELPFFQRESETSRLAAVSVYEAAPPLRQRVWEYIHAHGGHGATTAEIVEGLGLKGSTVRPRVVELREAGRLETTGRQRKTASGRFAAVHVAVEVG
jgi:hypothetical protein